MPFGLTNAPETFQRMMNEILRKYIDRCAMIVYLHDVVIFSKTEDEHIQNVLDVVRALHEQELILNEKKGKWGCTSILYPGHIASGEGLRIRRNSMPLWAGRRARLFRSYSVS